MNNRQRNYFSSEFKLGIVGGGQLGKMLLQETRRYDIQTKVLDPSAVAPCRVGCNEFVQGSLTDFEAVYNLGHDCDVITIEIENINTDALKKLASEGKKVFPQPEVIELIKSKVDQKRFYLKEGIPTVDFTVFEQKADLISAVENGQVTLPFVWKIDTGGFDGRGVSVIKKKDQIEELPEGRCFAEELIPFEKEMAVVVARSANGEIKAFPTVEMDFHPTANLVEYVFSPGLIPDSIKEQARALAEGIADKLGVVGILAVEMFITQDGRILINEVAPRVHNSGHLSIEGNISSQFDQHLRAILGLPLGDVETVKPAVMVNLVGDPDYNGPVKYRGIEEILKMPGVYVHLYGKAETRPFRKMGHVTIVANSLDEAREKAKKVKDTIKVISQ